MLSKGVGLFPTEPVGAMCDYVRLCESLGYDNVWFGDSQNIWRESSTVMGAAAVGTEKIVFGTGVTNAVTRHPSLLASTWATLAEFTGGRVALGIGTGDSSLRTMGLTPQKLAELEQSITRSAHPVPRREGRRSHQRRRVPPELPAAPDGHPDLHRGVGTEDPARCPAGSPTA